MSEKIIPRKELKKLVELTTTMKDASVIGGDFHEALNKRIPVAQKLSRKTGLDWLPFLDLLDSIIRFNGFKPEATLEDVERVLSVLGWQVSKK
jgi:hypothetical protein